MPPVRLPRLSTPSQETCHGQSRRARRSKKGKAKKGDAQTARTAVALWPPPGLGHNQNRCWQKRSLRVQALEPPHAQVLAITYCSARAGVLLGLGSGAAGGYW